MKKSKTIILILTVVAVLAGAGWILQLAYTMPPEEATALIEELKVYAMERVVPIASVALVGIAVILGTLAPVAKRVIDAAGKFMQATDSVQGTEASSRKATLAMETWKEEMAESQRQAIAAMERQYSEAFLALTFEMREALEAMQEAVKLCADRMDADHATVERTGIEARCMLDMMEAGLCNLPDVVASGAGVKIRLLAEQARADVAPSDMTAPQAAQEVAQAAEAEEGET